MSSSKTEHYTVDCIEDAAATNIASYFIRQIPPGKTLLNQRFDLCYGATQQLSANQFKEILAGGRTPSRLHLWAD
jgi:hypothetical protein